MFICECVRYLRAGVRLVLNGKEGNGLTSLASTASSANAVDVIFNSQGELDMLANIRW
jgi:hypothetical protein